MANLDQSRVNTYIIEAQENDLRPVLGDALYKDFIDNQSLTKYTELLRGKSYTVNGFAIDFPGVKPMLAYFTLARIVANNQMNITSYGIVQKTVNESQPVEQAGVKALVTELRSVAVSYQNRLIQFLKANTSTYPQYNQTLIAENNISGLNFFSA